MVSELNGRETYEPFHGKYTEQMPKLIADGRVPMSVAELMQRRLDVRNDPDDTKLPWMTGYFNTVDGAAYALNGNVKIVLGSEHLKNISPESTIKNGALVLTENDYKALQGEEFEKGQLGKIGDWLSREEIKAHPVWRALAGDQALLDAYADLVFAEGREGSGYERAMGVFLDSVHGNTPEMRAWHLSGLWYGSCIGGLDDFDDKGSFLLGIAPESQEIKSLAGRL